MTYRDRCSGRRTRQGQVKLARERRRYVDWRARVSDYEKPSTNPCPFGRAFEDEMNGVMIQMMRQLNTAMFAPMWSRNWTTWEERRAGVDRKVAARGLEGLISWVPVS